VTAAPPPGADAVLQPMSGAAASVAPAARKRRRDTDMEILEVGLM
jgi:hypothetical protein